MFPPLFTIRTLNMKGKRKQDHILMYNNGTLLKITSLRDKFAKEGSDGRVKRMIYVKNLRAFDLSATSEKPLSWK